MHHYFSCGSGRREHSLVFRGVRLVGGEPARSHFRRDSTSTKNEVKLRVRTLCLLIRVTDCRLLKFQRGFHTGILTCWLNSLYYDGTTHFIPLILILIWTSALNGILRVLGTFYQVRKLRLVLWCPDLLLNNHQVCDYLILGPRRTTKLTFHGFYPVLRVLSLMLVSWVYTLQIFAVCCTTSSLMFEIGTNNLSSWLQRYLLELFLSSGRL